MGSSPAEESSGALLHSPPDKRPAHVLLFHIYIMGVQVFFTILMKFGQVLHLTPEFEISQFLG